MTLQQLLQTLQSLEAVKASGGSRYKEITKLLAEEATTHNVEQAYKLLTKLKSK